MEWYLKYGDVIDRLLDCEKRGQRIGAFDSMPDTEQLEPYWSAFWQLSNARVYSETPRPIPFTEIETWLNLNGYFCQTFRYIFAAIIHKVDQAFVKRHRDDYKRKLEDNKPKPKAK